MQVEVRGSDIDGAIRILAEKVRRDGDLKRVSDRASGKTRTRADKRKRKELASLNRLRKKESKERRWAR